MTMKNRVLITGATGFIGHTLVDRLSLEGSQVRAVSRRTVSNFPANVELKLVGDLTPNIDWGTTLAGVDKVVHCAARTHVLNDNAVDSLAEFRLVNSASTLNLARQAAGAGVRRFVFISSIGVNGTETFGKAFSAGDKEAPHSPYAISKNEAEKGLRRIAWETGLEVVVIRPPLVFGAGAPGNVAKLLRIVNKEMPLPLGAIQNRRSLVALDNLIDLIAVCLHHPAAANETFLVSDGEDLSTTALLRRLAAALGKHVHLIPVPVVMVRFILRLMGMGKMAQQLCGSLQVDMRKTRDLLGWTPPVSTDDGLKQTAQNFLASLQK